ncbi:MAG: hypothetical protein P8Y96_01690 [Desulfuromonadales bacterium]|jgi:hypothetical protein
MSDTDHGKATPPTEPVPPETGEERFPELAELQDKIDRRLRSNQRFLERFMDEDYDELDEEDPDLPVEDDAPEIDEEF